MGRKSLDVGFRLDAGAAMGGGHLARCSALAEALRVKDWRSTIYCSEETLGFLKSNASFDAVRPLREEDLARPEALSGAHDAVVVDHYGLDADYEDALYARHFLCVFSDEANRMRSCHMLIDQNYGHGADDYKARVPEGCEILAGSEYVLLRSQYRDIERPKALTVVTHARNLLVTMGASDPTDVTGAIVRKLREMAPPEWTIRVVLGPAYRHVSTIKALAQDWPALEIVVAPPYLVNEIKWSHAVLTAAGSTCWELCYLGTPFGVFTLNTGSNINAAQLEEAGIAVDFGQVPSGSNFVAAMSRLMNGPERAGMAARAFALVDGKGALRICDHMERCLCAA